MVNLVRKKRASREPKARPITYRVVFAVGFDIFIYFPPPASRTRASAASSAV